MTRTTRRSFLRGARALALVPGMPALADADAATLAQAATHTASMLRSKLEVARMQRFLRAPDTAANAIW